MGVEESSGAMLGIAYAVVFLATFLAGDIAGLMIEARTTRHWRGAAEKMGMDFYGRRTRWPALSQFLVPKLFPFMQGESPFLYGESLNTLRGAVQGFEVTIADFAVWNYHVRGPLVFRGVVCVVRAAGVDLPDQTALVKASSIFLHGFRWSRPLREYTFSHDADFTRLYVSFGQPGSPPWIFTPDLRQICVKHHYEMDFFFVTGNDLILVWTDHNPERFPAILNTTMRIMTSLVEGAPRISQQAS